MQYAINNELRVRKLLILHVRVTLISVCMCGEHTHTTDRFSTGFP